jgi:hypothetical protein
MMGSVERINAQLELSKQLKDLVIDAMRSRTRLSRSPERASLIGRQLGLVKPAWTGCEAEIIEDHRPRVGAAAEAKEGALAWIDEMEKELRWAVG